MADIDRLAEHFRRHGHVRIDPFLSNNIAGQLLDHVSTRSDWLQVLNGGDKVFELSRATRAEMTTDKAATLDAAVWQGAVSGFQHRYESIRLIDGNDTGTGRSLSLLDAWVKWLSTGICRDVLRRITGASNIAYADGQATMYSPGDFLTGHDDAVAGKGRKAAYVLGLTQQWRIEWGGLLLFHQSDGTFHGVMPGFNTLDLFAVPQMHSVSAVVPAAIYPRYAITGWLRSAASDQIS